MFAHPFPLSIVMPFCFTTAMSSALSDLIEAPPSVMLPAPSKSAYAHVPVPVLVATPVHVHALMFR